MTNAQYARLWMLDQGVRYLNHGGFGAAPRALIAARTRWQVEFERNPLRFVYERFSDCYAASREALAAFAGTDPARLVFTTNATESVNIVLKSLTVRPGDLLLTTNHAYPGCRAALQRVAERGGAEVITVAIPYPPASPRELVEPILAAAERGPRLALIDHVSSESALVFPVREIVAGLAERGVDTLVDGAHAPGMLPLDIDALGAAWYAGNCHKWLCAPKTAGFLAAAPGRLEELEPLVTSFGRGFPAPEPERRQLEFLWRGTWDASAVFLLPEAIEYMGGLLPGGWPELMRRNHEMVLEGRRLLMDALGIEAAPPDDMLGSMATLPLPDHGLGPPDGLFREDRLARRLYERHRIEVPVPQWPRPGEFKLRVSAQLYNEIGDYEALAAALVEELRL